mgnify:CR=1 FL=1
MRSMYANSYNLEEIEKLGMKLTMCSFVNSVDKNQLAYRSGLLLKSGLFYTSIYYILEKYDFPILAFKNQRVSLTSLWNV